MWWGQAVFVFATTPSCSSGNFPVLGCHGSPLHRLDPTEPVSLHPTGSFASQRTGPREHGGSLGHRHQVLWSEDASMFPRFCTHSLCPSPPTPSQWTIGFVTHRSTAHRGGTVDRPVRRRPAASPNAQERPRGRWRQHLGYEGPMGTWTMQMKRSSSVEVKTLRDHL